MKSNEQRQETTCRFAWDGFSFNVPRDWDLSDYKFTGRTAMLKMEDDENLRLEMEWMRMKREVNRSALHNRCAEIAEELADAGAEPSPVGALPDGWSATLFSMPDGRRLLTAYRLLPGCRFFCLLQLHFPAASLREPPRLARQIASSFRLHDEETTIPWEFYDVSLRVNRAFRLTGTSLLAGQKLMAFEWRLRRLSVWFFSLADRILKQKKTEEWCADFLNRFKGIQGPRFAPGNDGEVLTRFSYRHPFGQFEEIARWCFRYQARCRLLAETNHIMLYAFNYRKFDDLALIAGLDKNQ